MDPAMHSSPDARAATVGLIAAVSAFVGVVLGLTATAALGVTSNWVGLLLIFIVAPALAVLGIDAVASRVAPVERHAYIGAVGALVGGIVGVVGVLLGGLFLFLGLFLLPSMFAYAAVTFAHIFTQDVVTRRGLGILFGVTTALYVPLAVFAIYQAIDRTAEAAGAREGAGWTENIASAIVLLSLYALILAAATSRHRRTPMLPAVS